MTIIKHSFERIEFPGSFKPPDALPDPLGVMKYGEIPHEQKVTSITDGGKLRLKLLIRYGHFQEFLSLKDSSQFL